MDLESRAVYKNNSPVECSRQEFDLLHFLMRRPENLVRKEELIEYIWKEYGDTSSRIVSLDKLVSRLREKLGKEGFNIIQTVYGEGYKFNPLKLQ